MNKEFKLCCRCNEIKPLDCEHWAWVDKEHTKFRNICRKCTNSDSKISHKKHKKYLNKKYFYALYYGDEFIDLGSIQYLSYLLGVKERTVQYYLSNRWKNLSNYESYIVIKVEDLED